MDFYFYKKFVSKETTLTFKEDKGFGNPSFSVVQIAEFEYSVRGFGRYLDWRKIAMEFIVNSIFSLVFNEGIRIRIKIFKWSFLNGLISFDSVGYFVEPTTGVKMDDILTDRIQGIVSSNFSHFQNLLKFSDLIEGIITMYLGKHKEYNNPQKVFLNNLFNNYGQTHDWLEIEEKTELLGAFRFNIVRINQEKYEELKKDHFLLREKINYELTVNAEFNGVYSYLRERIDTEFWSKEYSDSGDPD